MIGITIDAESDSYMQYVLNSFHSNVNLFSHVRVQTFAYFTISWQDHSLYHGHPLPPWLFVSNNISCYVLSTISIYVPTVGPFQPKINLIYTSVARTSINSNFLVFPFTNILYFRFTFPVNNLSGDYYSFGKRMLCVHTTTT